ncbi:MAG: alpha-L-fucosidase [Armatimonadota bacterium]
MMSSRARLSARRCLSTTLLGAVLLSTAVIAPKLVQAQTPAKEAQGETETKAQRDARMKWWREAKFGMFIHWGVYSVPAGYYQNKPIGGLGEWIMNDASIPVADYRRFAPQFTAAKYDPDSWVRLAKEAGMKYIVITSKHHDGFALFDSKASNWNVVKASPYGKDLLKPLAAACKKYGMKLGFYYSQAQDWVHPGGAAFKAKWDKAQEGDFDRYLDQVAIPQMKEILSNYGPISVLWFDTPASMTPERAARLLPVLKLQPGIIVNNRLGGGFKGDTETPEQRIPATGYADRDWETCMTLNNTWGFKKDDNNWKSNETLIRNLVDIASKGGNYLLNVGPTSEGVIPQPSVNSLKAVGKWMKTNGESIYDTTASPFKTLPWGRCTVKTSGGDITLYLHVFQWPAGGQLTVPGLKNRVLSARLMGGKGSLKAAAGTDGVIIQVPATAPDAISSTVVLKIAGTPTVEQARIKQDGEGQLLLLANEAVLHGSSLSTESKGGKDNLGYWTDADDWAEWAVTASRPGRYRVTAEIAAPKATAVTLRIGDQTVRGAAPATGSYDTFQKVELGSIDIKNPGNVAIELRPVAENWQPLNLRSIQLVPVP